jgi:hypothetical protein
MVSDIARRIREDTNLAQGIGCSTHVFVCFCVVVCCCLLVDRLGVSG